MFVNSKTFQAQKYNIELASNNNILKLTSNSNLLINAF